MWRRIWVLYDTPASPDTGLEKIGPFLLEKSDVWKESMTVETKSPRRTRGWPVWPWILLLGLFVLGSLSAVTHTDWRSSDTAFARENVATPNPKSPVRTELEQLQELNGLTICIFNYKGIGLGLFKRHFFSFRKVMFDGNATTGAVSRDGTEVAVSQLMTKPSSVVIVHPDGSDLREYGGIRANSQMCWSYDDSMLALGTPGPKIEVLKLKSKRLQEIASEERVTSQCWSPDSKQIVYESRDGNIFLYDLAKGTSTKLTRGTEPTWSPDGDWIAYRHGDTYYAIRPSGEGQKELFHKTRAVSALYWSPDSRFVTYVHQDFVAVGTEFYHLLVRRLGDNSEDWVADGADAGAGYNYQWVVNKQLLEQVKSEGKSK
jgi:hypothetical protein